MNGREFLAILDQEEKGLRSKAENYGKILQTDDSKLTEEVRTEINVLIGEVNLLSRGKLKQFRGLCQSNISKSSSKPGEPIPLDSDLAGFWDITSPLIDKLKMKFHQLDRRRNQQWTPIENESDPQDVNNRRRVVVAGGGGGDDRSKKLHNEKTSKKSNEDLKKLIEERRRQQQRTTMSNNSNPSDVEIFLAEKE